MARRQQPPRTEFTELRRREGINILNAAERGGVHPKTLERFEAGTGVPMNETLPKLAEAYGLAMTRFNEILAQRESVPGEICRQSPEIEASAWSGPEIEAASARFLERHVAIDEAVDTNGLNRRRILLGSFSIATRWLAWRMWQRAEPAVHESDVPADYRSTLATHAQVVRDEQGYLHFSSPTLIDALVAQQVYEDVASGSDLLLSTVQTSHACDLRVGQLATDLADVQGSLRRWMTQGHSPVLRVNAAGVLAKAGGIHGDQIVGVLRADAEARSLYLTAVFSRVLSLPWDEASETVQGLDQSTLTKRWGPERCANAAVRFAAELENRRDLGARWCSTVALSHLSEAIPDSIVKAALGRAALWEPCTENLRAMAMLLSGQQSHSMRPA